MGDLYIQRGGRARGPSPLAMLLLGVLIAAAVGGAAYYFFVLNGGPPPRFGGNAVWLGVTWANDPHPEDEIRLLAQHLRDYHIRDVYVYVSYLRVDSGEWNPTFEHVRDFVRIFKEAAPELRLFSWLGVPVRMEDGTYRLDDAAVREDVAQFARRTVDQFDFDGVHLNVETIFEGNADYLVLLETVRETLAPEMVLSVSAPPDWNPGRDDVPVGEGAEEGMFWSQDYKQQVARHVDQVALMSYNSLLASPADYEKWMAYQVEAFSAALAGLEAPVALVVGVPTYAEAPGHDEWAESLRAALNGVRDGVERAGEDARVVAGVGLYAFWDTDAVEWLLYREMWLR